MTVSDQISDSVTIGEEEAVRQYGASSGIQGAGARTRARQRPGGSVTASQAASADVTEGGEIVPAATAVQLRAQGVADTLAARWQAKVGTAPPLAHARPPSLAQAREHVHAAAGHLNGPLWVGLRLAYGYLHLGLKLVLHAIEYATRSPWGLLITAFVVLIVIEWI